MGRLTGIDTVLLDLDGTLYGAVAARPGPVHQGVEAGAWELVRGS
jgi:hypothetical protein